MIKRLNCRKSHIHKLISNEYLLNLQEFEDGEILVESEPTRYELRDIKKLQWSLKVVPNVTVLGEAMLTNTGEYSNTVETVITYQFQKVVYWGTVEGVTRGLPTEVVENAKSTPVKLAQGWGFKVFDPITEVRVIQPPVIYVHILRCNNN